MSSRGSVASRDSVGRAKARISEARATARAAWGVEVESMKGVETLMARGMPEVHAALTDELGAMEKNARKQWPERQLLQTRKNDDGTSTTVVMPVVHGASKYPGFSRDSIGIVWRIVRDRIAASLVVRAPYAYYVKAKELGKNAYQALIFKPADAMVSRLAERIGKDIAR